ncbi:MAG: LuxR C-terminal-related transcriptional regulator [Lachnospiraceae bacterium]|nr:LuxR C-terminal-related transcriptional regulator [Lachnospiraceae bacterium]
MAESLLEQFYQVSMAKPFKRDVLLSRIRLRIKQAGEKKDEKAVALQEDNLTEFSPQGKDALKKVLTPTEMKIAQYIALGYTNREIASQLNYSYSYMKKCGSVILSKLELKHRGSLRRYI